MPKFESQTMLVAVLRTFTGKLSPAYVSEQEFFLTSLNSMAKYLYDLQQATLRDMCEGFLLKINSGKFTQEMITDFKTTVDSLISAADFRTVNAGMAGSREFIKRRLSALKPVSRVAEGNKPEGGDPDALRHIRDTYVRLNFDELAAQLKASPEEASINAVLARAREEVAEYCRLYRVPLNEEETMTPFSLSCIDAALAASFRLLNGIYQPANRK